MGRRVRTWAVRGPLAPWAAGFEGWLAARGFSSSAVYHRVCLLACLSRWLEREGLGAEQLTAERAELFLGARRAAGYVTWVSPRSGRQLLFPFRDLGVRAGAADHRDHQRRARQPLAFEFDLLGRGVGPIGAEGLGNYRAGGEARIARKHDETPGCQLAVVRHPRSNAQQRVDLGLIWGRSGQFHRLDRTAGLEQLQSVGH